VAAAGQPHLRKQGTATQLVVDGQPFLARGGELSNSHGEPDYLRPAWPKLKALNLNTVVTAGLLGRDRTCRRANSTLPTVDGLIADARANEMHLVLLWFGSWKNSMSCYTPAWVKVDPRPFSPGPQLDGSGAGNPHAVRRQQS